MIRVSLLSPVVRIGLLTALLAAALGGEHSAPPRSVSPHLQEEVSDAVRTISEVGSRFDPPLVRFQSRELVVESKTKGLIERLSGVKRRTLAKAKLFLARTKSGERRRVISLPLDGEIEGSSIALAIDESGKLLDGRLFGSKRFDEDVDQSWKRTIEQFTWIEIQVRDPSKVDLGFDAEEYWSALLSAGTEEAKLTRTLYETRRLMMENSDFYQRLDLAEKAEQIPARDWIESYLVLFSRLDEIAQELQPSIGEKAAGEFSSSAREIGALVAELTEAAGREDRNAFSSGFSRLQNACFNCHKIRGHGLGWDGPLVFPVLETRLKDFGVRDDLFRVGMDVWALRGEEESVQTIANAIQAVLLLAGVPE